MKTLMLLIAFLIGVNANAAFIKTTTTPQGASANYWSITEYDVNVVKLTVKCTVSLYLSSTSFAAGDSSFQTKYLQPITIQSSDLANSGSTICQTYINSNYTSGTPKDTFLLGATQQ